MGNICEINVKENQQQNEMRQRKKTTNIINAKCDCKSNRCLVTPHSLATHNRHNYTKIHIVWVYTTYWTVLCILCTWHWHWQLRSTRLFTHYIIFCVHGPFFLSLASNLGIHSIDSKNTHWPQTRYVFAIVVDALFSAISFALFHSLSLLLAGVAFHMRYILTFFSQEK